MHSRARAICPLSPIRALNLLAPRRPLALSLRRPTMPRRIATRSLSRRRTRTATRVSITSPSPPTSVIAIPNQLFLLIPTSFRLVIVATVIVTWSALPAPTLPTISNLCTLNHCLCLQRRQSSLTTLASFEASTPLCWTPKRAASSPSPNEVHFLVRLISITPWVLFIFSHVFCLAPIFIPWSAFSSSEIAIFFFFHLQFGGVS